MELQSQVANDIRKQRPQGAILVLPDAGCAENTGQVQAAPSIPQPNVSEAAGGVQRRLGTKRNEKSPLTVFKVSGLSIPSSLRRGCMQ